MPFQAGKSGNPKGRKPVSDAERKVQLLARQHTEEAITKLAEWMLSDNAKASVSACVALLDRGWGKPAQTIEANIVQHIVTDERLTSIRSVLRHKAEDPETRTVQ